MQVWLNGKLVGSEQASVSVLDHGLLYGDGVFEGIRVYGGRIFQCRRHIERLYASAKSVRLAIPIGPAEMTAALEQTVSANGLSDGYIRLLVTRGVGDLGLNPFICKQSNVVIIADKIQLYPPEMYENGMAVIIAKTRRTSPDMLPPSVKSMNYLNNIMAKMEAIDAGAGEAIMLNAAGQVAEATGDNVFIVAGGQVITPPPEAGILVGITRQVVLDLCRELAIPAVERTILPPELYQAQECFLTGTAAEVIAVTRIDGRTIGSGKSGPVTNRLLKAFRNFIRTTRA